MNFLRGSLRGAWSRAGGCIRSRRFAAFLATGLGASVLAVPASDNANALETSLTVEQNFGTQENWTIVSPGTGFTDLRGRQIGPTHGFEISGPRDGLQPYLFGRNQFYKFNSHPREDLNRDYIQGFGGGSATIGDIAGEVLTDRLRDIGWEDADISTEALMERLRDLNKLEIPPELEGTEITPGELVERLREQPGGDAFLDTPIDEAFSGETPQFQVTTEDLFGNQAGGAVGVGSLIPDSFNGSGPDGASFESSAPDTILFNSQSFDPAEFGNITLGEALSESPGPFSIPENNFSFKGLENMLEFNPWDYARDRALNNLEGVGGSDFATGLAEFGGGIRYNFQIGHDLTVAPYTEIGTAVLYGVGAPMTVPFAEAGLTTQWQASGAASFFVGGSVRGTAAFADTGTETRTGVPGFQPSDFVKAGFMVGGKVDLTRVDDIFKAPAGPGGAVSGVSAPYQLETYGEVSFAKPEPKPAFGEQGFVTAAVDKGPQIGLGVHRPDAFGDNNFFYSIGGEFSGGPGTILMKGDPAAAAAFAREKVPSSDELIGKLNARLDKGAGPFPTDLNDPFWDETRTEIKRRIAENEQRVAKAVTGPELEAKGVAGRVGLPLRLGFQPQLSEQDQFRAAIYGITAPGIEFAGGVTNSGAIVGQVRPSVRTGIGLVLDFNNTVAFRGEAGMDFKGPQAFINNGKIATASDFGSSPYVQVGLSMKF